MPLPVGGRVPRHMGADAQAPDACGDAQPPPPPPPECSCAAPPTLLYAVHREYAANGFDAGRRCDAALQLSTARA